MNQASDYGYTIAGQLPQHRDAETCLRHAAQCDRLADVDIDRADWYRQQAHAWRIEADSYRIHHIRN